MKTGIHPKYFEDAVINCSCGATFKVGTTVQKLQVEICSDCHPFYTGKQKLMDTAGRLDKYYERQKRFEELKQNITEKGGKKKKQRRKGIFEFTVEAEPEETPKKAKKEVKPETTEVTEAVSDGSDSETATEETKEVEAKKTTTKKKKAA